jgi:DNA ligase 1
MTFKSPMLAKDYDESQLPFPRYASVKLDGWRAVIHDGIVTTRSGKPVRNAYIQSLFGHAALNGLDGELIVGAWNEQETFNRTDSGCKKEAGEPDVVFHVFDCYDLPNDTYMQRRKIANDRVEAWRRDTAFDGTNRVEMLDQTMLYSIADLESFEEYALDEGFEGVMLRDMDSYYKYGRSTVREGYLLKVKRTADAEAQIVEVLERFSNDNVAFKDELGRTKRTSHQENKTPLGMVGAFMVQSPEWPRPFKIGSGNMSHEEAKRLWEIRGTLTNETIVFKYLVHGVKEVPRHGRFKGFRAPEDSKALA